MGTSRSNEFLSWVPVSEVAGILGVSRQRVHQLVREGGLVGRKVGSLVFVSLRSVEARQALLETEDRRHTRDW